MVIRARFSWVRYSAPVRTTRPRNANDGRPATHGADRSALPNVVDLRPIIPGTERNAEEVRTTNTSSFHATIPLRDATNRVQSTALIPYTTACGAIETHSLLRPLRLTPEGNCEITSTVNQNARMRSECGSRMEESRAFWMRLRYHTPDGPFGPTEGFIDDAIRLGTLCFTYLEIAGLAGGSAARQHLESEMLRLRNVHRIPRYMRRWLE